MNLMVENVTQEKNGTMINVNVSVKKPITRRNCEEYLGT